MIELAPNSKRGLELSNPLILAAGGYGGEYNAELLASAGAIVTLPTTLRARAPTRRDARVSPVPGGFLVNTGGANPGLLVVLRTRRHAWRKTAAPVILALAAEDAVHWAEVAARAASTGVVSGLECETVEELQVETALRSIKNETDLPLLAKIPIERATELAERAIASGVDALTVGLGPRGLAYVNGKLWQGRLQGAALKPLALGAIRAVAEKFPEVPLIGAGGVQTPQDAQDFLAAGALAVQVEVALWRDPDVIRRWSLNINDAATDQKPMAND